MLSNETAHSCATSQRCVAVDALLSDEGIYRARVAQGRLLLGPNENTGEERDEDTAVFYAIPSEQMQAAIRAALPGEGR